jgi:hypothetical protein
MEVPSLEWLMDLRDKGSMEAQMAEETEKKTIKFQMMLSEAEAATIDDWGFSRRIRSRAEAIRRLCQMGIAYDDDAVRDVPARLAKQAHELLNASDALLNKEKKIEPETIIKVAKILNGVVREQVQLLHDLSIPLAKASHAQSGDDIELIAEKTKDIEKAIRDALADSREILEGLASNNKNKPKPSDTEG